ncbi:MAG: hypothetical protein MI724_17565, partial [Spirochaetales bacterium]|nr:hypothetical protein [Spirochaetales bacterium]
MDVPATPSELSPGRIQALLDDGRAEVRVSRAGRAAEGGPLAIRLRLDELPGRGPSPLLGESVPPSETEYRVAAPGGGLAALIATVVRAERIEGRRNRNGEVLVRLPAPATAWITDRALLWAVLCGTFGAAADTPDVEEVDSGALRPAVSERRLWHCRLQTRDAGDPIAAWLVAETDSESQDDHPSRRLAAGLNMMRDVLRRAGLGEVHLKVRRQPPSSIGGGSAVLRMTSPSWRTFWPMGTVVRLLEALLSRDLVAVDSRLHDRNLGDRERLVALQRAATLRLLDAEVTTNGLVRLLQSLPRTSSEKIGRYAVRTVIELARADGVATREFVESAYRSGAAYRDLAGIVRWLPGTIRDRLALSLGRRWEQLMEHGARRPPPATDGSGRAYPWIAVPEACERLVSDLALRARSAGRGLAAATGNVVERFYTAPRGERLRAVWRRQLAAGELGR